MFYLRLSDTYGMTNYVSPKKNIAAEEFRKHEYLHKVDLSKALDIGMYAFCECTSLSEVILPNNLKILRKGTFANCYSLKSITLPETLEIIEEGCFSGCGLQSITIPKGTTLQPSVFQRCHSLRKVNWTTNYVPSRTFFSCESLEEFNFENVTTIGNDAFSRSGLTKVDLPKIQRLGDETFEGCSELLVVNINKSLMKNNDEQLMKKNISSIPNGCFRNCVKLTKINLPDSINHIGTQAFNSCKSLKNIRLPNFIKLIERETFEYCTSLENIVIPNDVTRIGYRAFRFCKSLRNVIMSNVETIGYGAFENCISLKNINESIDENTVVLPTSLKFLDFSAFMYSGIENIVINPAKSMMIQRMTFQDCRQLKTVHLSSNVRIIDSCAFSGCISLEKVHCENENVYEDNEPLRGFRQVGNEETTMDNDDTTDDDTIDESSLQFIDVYAWRDYISEYGYGGLITIGTKAFAGCKQLKHFEFPRTLRNIQQGAFQDCLSLEIGVSKNVITLDEELTDERIEDGWEDCKIAFINRKALYCR